MTREEIQKAINDIERQVGVIFRSVPPYAKNAMPHLAQSAEAVLVALEHLQARLLIEGVEIGETEEP